MPLPFSLDPDKAASANGRHDFDFLIGRWTVAHRRLRRRLEGDSQWDQFGGRCEMRPLLGGTGNVDDNIIELPDGTYRGSALRLFDPADRAVVDLVGGRAAGPACSRRCTAASITVSERSSATTRCAARPIRVRYIWSDIAADVGDVDAGLLAGRRGDVGNQLDRCSSRGRTDSPRTGQS